MTKQITEYFLYRWRYVLGYSFIGIVIAGLLFVAGTYIPGGITKSEMQSVVMSSNLSFSLSHFDPSMILNLPYRILQRASIELLGISNFSIKLPSLILGALSIIGMLLLLRMWFRRNVAVITTFLVLTTGQFLFVAQSGNAGIVYVFWSVWLLLSATFVSRQAKWTTFWKVILFGIAALSLYTPLSIYILLALVGAIMLHPHLRFLVRRLSKSKLIIAGVCALVLVAPLGYAIFLQPSLGLTLLGIPDNNPTLTANAIQLLRQYFDFISPSSSMLMTPVYGLGSMALILLGIFRLATTKYTARSYLITAWIVLLLPVLLVNPTFTSVTFVPIMLLMAMGISALINNWYQLFPRNPYARIAGLIPLAVLIGGMMFTGIDRYTYGYLYDPNTAGNFSKDLTLFNNALKDKDRGKTVVVADKDEIPFYTAVAKYKDGLQVTTTNTIPAKTTLFTHDAKKTAGAVATPYRIVTDGMVNESDRFYIYKTDAK